MGANENVKTIQGVYEAFGRGDLEVVLDAVTDDVHWAAEASSTAAPWYGVRHGKDGLASFFEAFGSTMEVNVFDPYAFAANDTEVHRVERCRATSRATGKVTDHDLHHYFRFENGRIAFYRGSEDTAQTEAALRP